MTAKFANFIMVSDEGVLTILGKRYKLTVLDQKWIIVRHPEGTLVREGMTRALNLGMRALVAYENEGGGVRTVARKSPSPSTKGK